MAEIKKYQIELRCDNRDNAEDVSALADELRARGHEVSVRKSGPMGEWARTSKRDLLNFAENVRDAAESSVQKLREAIGPFVNKPVEKHKSEDKTEKPNPDGGFDEIGPGAARQMDENRAVISTYPELMADAPWDAMRIGLVLKTTLDRPWKSNGFDAIVVPHPSFRPYLESIAWPSDRIFEGGYVARPESCPTMGHDDAMLRFRLNEADGPVLLIMAGGFETNKLQTLMVQISLIKQPVQVFFNHAGDPSKAESLRNLAQRFGVSARMFGHMDDLPNYMVMADLVVISSDDPCLQIVENAAIPAIAVPQREVSPLAKFMEHEQSLRMAGALNTLSASVASLLSDNNALSQMRGKAVQILNYASTARCADGIEAVLAAQADILKDPSKRAPLQEGFDAIGQKSVPFGTAVKPSDMAVQSNGGVNPPAQTPQANASAMLTPTISRDAEASILSPVLNARTKEELQEEYTRLILAEKSLEKSLDAISDEVRMWEGRVDLARQNNREDLASQAMARLISVMAEEKALMQQKDELKQQKEAIRAAARGARSNASAMDLTLGDDLFGSSPEDNKLEAEFKKLQNDDALRRLHEKLRK